jgi:hypothetical protein
MSNVTLEENELSSRHSIASRADDIITSEHGKSILSERRQQENRLIQNAGQVRHAKMDVQNLMAKAPNIPLYDVNGHMTGSPDRSSVEAVGFAVVADDSARLPANKFFSPGRVFAVRVKHSSFPACGPPLSNGSRASYKTMSIKFSDHDVDSPLDLVLKTGHHGPYYNVVTMDQFYAALRTGNPDIKNYLLEHPVCLESVLDGLRFEADSYTDQHYYSHFIYEFLSTDGYKRTARFRATPVDQSWTQTGLLTLEQQRHVWNYLVGQSPEYTSTQPESFLREEFSRRLAAAGFIEYRLQIQLGEQQAYCPCDPGPEAAGEWLDLARLTLGQVLGPFDGSSAGTLFNVGRLPPSTLHLADPNDPADFNSAPAVESHLAGETEARRLKAAMATARSQQSQSPSASLLLTDYLVHCVTGDRLNAGTTSNIFISIVGTKGRTPYMQLNSNTKTDLERDKRKTFILQERPVGPLRYVQVYNEGGSSTNDSHHPDIAGWYLSYAVVSTPYNGRCYTLPCYRWITGRHVATLRDGAAC